MKKKAIRERLERIFNRYENKPSRVRILDVPKEILAPSRIFDVARFEALIEYKGRVHKKLNLVLKSLKKNAPSTDFSNLKSSIHKEVGDLTGYADRLFNIIQGNMNNGSYNSGLVKYYGEDNNVIFEEDAGEVSMEKLFIERGPDNNLLEKLIEVIAVEHSKWELRLKPNINELLNLKKEDNYDLKLRDNLKVILNYNEEKLSAFPSYALEVLENFFNNVNNYFKSSEFDSFLGLIHSDLHLGHVLLKYGGGKGKKFSSILKMSKDELRQKKPKFKLIDITGVSIGPQTFDLADVINHPVSINIEDFPNKDLIYKRDFIEDLIDDYINKRVEMFLTEHNVRIHNGELEIKRNDLLAKFYISGLYRNIRAATKGILLREKNVGLYDIYKEINPSYPKYISWYIADLGENLRYIASENKFDNSLKDHIPRKSIEEFYNVLNEYIDGLEDDSSKIHKEIVHYNSEINS